MSGYEILPRKIERAEARNWPYRPRPLENELLSSFIFRLSEGHGVKPITFLNSVMGSRKNLLAQDIDNFAPQTLIERLSTGCEIPVDDLERCVLDAYAGTLNRNHNKRGRNPWVLPITIDNNRRHRPGLQFCPDCLRADRAHFRQQWRLAFVTSCSKHGTLLRDRCPHCASPVVLHEMNSSYSCHDCGEDIRVATRSTSPEQLTWQYKAEIGLVSGWMALEGEFIPTAVWFIIARQVGALLVNGPKAEKFRQTTAALYGGDPTEFLKPTRRQPFEYLEVEERHRLFEMVARLMTGWPYRFVHAAWDAGIRKSHAIKDLRQVPFVLERTLSAYLDETPYYACDAEVAAAAAWLRKTKGAAYYRDLKAICGESRKAIYRHMDYQRKQQNPSKWLARVGR